MALHLEEVPEFRCTINLVPSLLTQLEAYVARRDRHPPHHVAQARRRARARRCALPARQFLHGVRRLHDPPASPVPRAVHACGRRGPSPAEQALLAVPAARPARPPGLVQPGLDPPPALREGPRARRVQGQGAALHRGREAVAARQAARAARPGHPPASQAGRARAGRADHDALLPPDPAPAARQEARPRGHARREAARLPRGLPRGRRGPRPPRGREPHRDGSASAPGHVAQRGLGLPGDDPAAGPARHRVDRHRRGDPRAVPPTARSGATAGATSGTPSCCTGPGRCSEGDTSWRSSSATTRCRTRSASTTSAVPGRRPRATSWASCTPSATPAGTTRPRSSR